MKRYPAQGLPPLRYILTPPIRISTNFVVIPVLAILLAGCASPKSEDLIPRPVALAKNATWLKGSLSVQAAVPPYRNAYSHVKMSDWVDSSKFRFAVENTLAENGLFSPAVENDPDYVLDVWVLGVKSGVNVFGEGFMIEMVSVWRLTRVEDGKVLVCDVVHGYGASHALGSAAHSRALAIATKETIQNGLAALCDGSVPHESAVMFSIRPSMGNVVPQDLQRIKEAWPKLQIGLQFDEVMKLVDPSLMIMNAMKTAALKMTIITSPDPLLSLRIRSGEGVDLWQYSGVDDLMFSSEMGKTKCIFLAIRKVVVDGVTMTRYATVAYNLYFADGKLKKWQLRDTSVEFNF